MIEMLEKIVDLYKKNSVKVDVPKLELQQAYNTCECYTCNCDCKDDCNMCYDY